MKGHVAFDFDGTLVRSNRVKRDCFYDVAGDVPGAVAVLDELFAANFEGDRHALFRELVRRLAAAGGPVADPEALAADYGRLCHARIAAAAEVPGARAALDRLKAAGVRLYLVSATPQAPLEALVAARGLAGFFEHVLGGPDDKPTHLRGIAGAAGVKPADLVLVGDGRDDQAAAALLGCRFIGVSDEPKAPLEAAVTIPDLRALPRLLGLPGTVEAAPGAGRGARA